MRLRGIVERLKRRHQGAPAEDSRGFIQPDAEDAPEGQETPSEEEPGEEEDRGMRRLEVELTEEQWESLGHFVRREIRHFDGKPEKTDRTLMLLAALRRMSMALRPSGRGARDE